MADQLLAEVVYAGQMYQQAKSALKDAESLLANAKRRYEEAKQLYDEVRVALQTRDADLNQQGFD